MADFGLPHSSFLFINKTAFKKFGAIDQKEPNLSQMHINPPQIRFDMLKM